MKKLYIFLFVAFAMASFMTACVEEQDDLRYNGPTVAEFKNRYLEYQQRVGTGLFQSANYNIVTVENTSLSKITTRQPAVTLAGVITTTGGSPTVTGQGVATFTGSILGNTLTVTTAPVGGLLGVGVEIAGGGVTPGTTITRLITGTTGLGTYVVNNSQTVASTALSTISTQFLTQVQVGSIVKTSTGTILGVVSAIASDVSMTLAAPVTTALTRAPYRVSFAQGISAPAFQDSILVQLVGKQVATDLTVTYIKDPTNPLAPVGTQEAVEGIHYNFVRNNAGELVVKGNSNAGYIYLNILESLTPTDPDRVVLMITLTDGGDVLPSQNYKTFTYTIIK